MHLHEKRRTKRAGVAGIALRARAVNGSETSVTSFAQGSLIIGVKMKKNLNQDQVKNLVKLIKTKLSKINQARQTTVFLCGGDVKDERFGRHKMANLFSKHDNYEVLYPEDIFDDLLAGQGQFSLLSLENLLADAVDAIVIFPESPGSYTELGAFCNNPDLARKLICVQDARFKYKKSFINYGPIRLLKTNRMGKLLTYNNDDFSDYFKARRFFRKVSMAISNIKSKNPVKVTADNIIYSEDFILPCIYLMDEINNILLYEFLKQATGMGDTLCEIATKSALGRLIDKQKIVRTIEGYHVTELGAAFVRDNYARRPLDSLRLEIMNFENRSKATINYDRVS